MKKLISTIILMTFCLPVFAGWRSLETITANVGTSDETITSTYEGVWMITSDADVFIEPYGDAVSTTFSFVVKADTTYNTGFATAHRVLPASSSMKLATSSGTANVRVDVIEIEY